MTTEFSSFYRQLPQWAAILALMLVASVSPWASASQSVSIGEVEVESSGEAAFQEAMRVALVRLSGRRSAADDPVFEALVRDARRYVQIVRPAANGMPARITLDTAAIERAMQGLRQAVWSLERPLVLGVVTTAPAGADPAKVREALERAASERGLPLRLSAAASVGLVSGRAVGPEVAIDAARRSGADVALIGEADGAEWQWTLFDGATATVFQGGPTAGVEGAADTLALNSLATVSRPLSETELRVGGVLSLKDYAEVRRMLIALPVVKSAELVAAEGDGAVFRVEVAGGAAGLAEALAAQPRLRRESGRDGLPRYRFGR
ncbi:MAG: DUF2066 domain-containing protein [Gammaproteobacteria bacterium]